MKTIHPGHMEHRFCIFGCQILCITDLAIMPLQCHKEMVLISTSFKTFHIEMLNSSLLKISGRFINYIHGT